MGRDAEVLRFLLSRRAGRLLGHLLLFSVVLAMAATPVAAQTGPPGNNGFIKVNGEELDDIPNNDPHVGCSFLVEFYNYDEGDLTAEVTFIGIPPTGGGVLLQDTVFIGEDPPGGGDDLDAAVEYTLDFTGIEPHPQQGFHVLLRINAEGSAGADVKHKVFWVECEQPTTPPPTTPPPTTPPPTTPPTSPPPGTTPPTDTTAPPPPTGAVEAGGGQAPSSAVPTAVALFLLVASVALWRLRASRS